MKKIKYFIVSVMVFCVCGLVKAENIDVRDVIAKFQAEEGYSVTSQTDGSAFTVNTGTENIEFTYSASDNILSYNLGSGKTPSEAVGSDKVLRYIVDLSSNNNEYRSAKEANTTVSSVDYGSGCNLVNMGFCYDNASGKMQVVLSNQFTTYLYNYYTGNTTNQDNMSTPDGTSVASVDPTTTEESTIDSKNPETGSFTEFGIIIALLALLLVVIVLKKRNETEFKI